MAAEGFVLVTVVRGTWVDPDHVTARAGKICLSKIMNEERRRMLSRIIFLDIEDPNVASPARLLC
jgi:hypothetical protein